MPTNPKLRIIGFVIAGTLAPATAHATEWFASPSGTGEACTQAAPCDLKTALCESKVCKYAVQPGDTIWLRGGTYKGGPFVSRLKGTAASPIVVRQYAGERATIDGNAEGAKVTLEISGAYAWYWGFEIFNSDPTRSSPDGEDPPRRSTGVHLLGEGTRMINMIVHDTSQGVLASESSADGKIYGCLLYYNGFDSPDRGHGHGMYVQNADARTKEFHDNILFEQFGWGIHAYGEGGHLDNMDFQGNISFDNGGLSGQYHSATYHANILVGGFIQAQSPKLISNYTYNSAHKGKNDLGYSGGSANAIVQDNYFVSGDALDVSKGTGLTITGNTFYGKVSGFSQTSFAGNTFFDATRPTGVKVFVRPNAFEPKRANVVVYNWDLQDTVAVDVSSVLTSGDRYEVRNVADYFGPPVSKGTYPGGSISLPMKGLSVAAPIGAPTPSATGPEFNVFVLMAEGAVGPPPPDNGGPEQSTGPAAGNGNGNETVDDMKEHPVGDSGCSCQLRGRARAPASIWIVLVAGCALVHRSMRRRRSEAP